MTAAGPLGLSGGHVGDRAAEEWLDDLLGRLGIPAADVFACTHHVRSPYPHVALSLVLPAGAAVGPADLPPVPAELLPAAAEAAGAHAARRSGRAVHYPGRDRLVGELTVAELLSASAIDRVEVLGGSPPAPDTVLVTRDFVRPQWRTGALVLTATPAGGGRIAPFEVRNPTPCCADHATA